MALEDDILSVIAREPGLKYPEIAQRLGVEGRVVKLTLRQLKARSEAWQDAGYRWWLVPPGEAAVPPQGAVGETPLARLCRYYLHCLGLDYEAGVGVRVRSRQPDFVELPALPDRDPDQRGIGAFPGVSELIERLRHGAARQVPYLGYPVRLGLIYLTQLLSVGLRSPLSENCVKWIITIFCVERHDLSGMKRARPLRWPT